VQLRDHIDNNIDGVLCANITVSLSSTVIIPQNADFDLSCGGNTCLILSALEIQLFRTEVTTASGNGHDVSFTGIIFEQALTTAVRILVVPSMSPYEKVLSHLFTLW
jgi:hypothetical protein